MSKKPTTMSGPLEEGMQQDQSQAKYKKLDSSQDKSTSGLDQNTESVLVLHAVLSSGQLILSTNNKATVPSLSFDNFDNFTASPSSEQEIRNDVPGPMNKAAKHLRHQLVWPIFIVSHGKSGA